MITLLYWNFNAHRHEDEVYSGWTEKVDEVAKTNLEKPILLRNAETGLISVNFDPQVSCLYCYIHVSIFTTHIHIYITHVGTCMLQTCT